jgi:Ca2+-binding RTX toxin-like protein
MKSPRRVVVLLACSAASAALAFGSMPATSVAAGQTCAGRQATVTASQGRVTGTPGVDVIILTGAATVLAGAGNDLICGSNFADTILGGPGDDVIFGRPGDDTISGGPGADHLFGDRGDDRLMGGSDDDALFSGPGNDTLLGGAGLNTASRAQTVVVVQVSNNDLSDLRSVGYSLIVAGKPTSTTSELPVIASTAPMQMNTISVDSAASAFYADGLLMPGVTVAPGAYRAMQPGQQLLIEERGTSADIGVGVGPGPRGTYSVRNGTTREWLSGLSFDVVMNGRASLSPLSASSIASGSAQILRKPKELLIGFSSVNQSGTLLPSEGLRMITTTPFTAGDVTVLTFKDGRFTRQ